MSIAPLPPTIPLSGVPGVDAFQSAAAQGPQVVVAVDGRDLRVLAQGSMDGGSAQRSVAWVQSDLDVAGMFMQALSQAYGGGISAAVARELGLEPAPGRPLESRLVLQAVDMAQTGQRALAGVDFLTQLEHSAAAQGSAFRTVLADMGLAPSALSSTQRQQIDAAMTDRFLSATQAGEVPVTPETAASWLKDTISRLTNRAD